MIGKPLTDFDPKTVEGARQTMQELWQGKPVQIELHEKVTGENDAQWVAASKNTAAHAAINKKTGKVEAVNIMYAWDELDESLEAVATLKANVTQAMQTLDPKGDFKVEGISRSNEIHRGMDSWMFYDGVENALRGGVDAATGQVRGVTAEYPIGQVDASYVKHAQAALKELSGGATDALDSMVSLGLDGTTGRKSWSFGDVERTYHVEIDDATNRLVSVGNYNKYKGYNTEEELRAAFAAPYYTTKAALAAAGPLVQKYFQPRSCCLEALLRQGSSRR
ncbi:hypothetical protein [Paenibacillus tyrfis]|uniref:hypothetical protein n=1 Tax=Paenibacillus tyrfis TaxID=1501230 RepID=UPI0020A11B38|nr:hypothetical protein [Paenibacillus tyrfis]MCP1308106.1 hypothetical protein [Paenibacillus tyrfis]